MKLNQCPQCKSKITLRVDAIDSRWAKEEDQYSSIDFVILSNGMIKDKKLPKHLSVCDKDRLVVCDTCCLDSSYSNKPNPLHEIAKQLKLLNPNML
jgi:predicted house-cleaning NTP pyrophosphatase (Maf/HAM1 superfamily)